MQAYWSQYNTEEIVEIQGVETTNEYEDCEMEYDNDEEDEEEEYYSCCSGGGCNFCLMLDY